MPKPFSHPILSCSEAIDWENGLLGNEEEAWAAMTAVGAQLARGIKAAYAMSTFPQTGLEVIALIGKGHNGGDALLALSELALHSVYLKRVVLVLGSDRSMLKPNTERALKLLQERAPVELHSASKTAVLSEPFDICIDGLLGMQFRPPLREPLVNLIHAANQSKNIRMRVAVDLPSGLGDESDETVFQADITFATGIFKGALLNNSRVGLVRYLDIGFFEQDAEAKSRVVVDSILNPLRALRPADSEKRRHGHLAIVAGSRGMPGALAMCVRSALRSGVGLLTVFAPESVVSQLACNLPEAMWRTWPETPEGGLALEGIWQIRSIVNKASALLMGPGMGAEAETLTLMCDIGRTWNKPVVLDADALRPEIVDAFADAERILTPHDGELKRLVGRAELDDSIVAHYGKENGLTLVRKGCVSRISDGETLFVNTSGNPVLSRGGSGDLLAGLMAGLLAQGHASAVEVACRAVYWHGKAADLLAEERGQVSVRTTDLLEYLGPALRS